MDEARAMHAAQYLNLVAGYQQVKNAVAAHSVDSVQTAAWAAWKLLADAEKEEDNAD